MSHITQPFNAAYTETDRSHLYQRYDVEPVLDDGELDPETGTIVAPGDFRARYEAVLEFYGYRCGRCGRQLATPARDAEAIGRVYSVGRVRGADSPWALSELVALCPACYDLVDATDADDLETVCTRYEAAPQFPTWLCDPRVAVERAPLSARELFYRERLERQVRTDRFEFGVNEAVASSAVLALSTPASVAVAFGERLVADATCPPQDSECHPDRAWDALSAPDRATYERRTLDAERIAATGQWRRPRSTVRPSPEHEEELAVEF